MPDFIPAPTIVMMGCRAWDAQPRSPGDCPACKGGIRRGHDGRYCARCDSLSPRYEAKARSARLGLESRSASEDAEREAQDMLGRKRVSLTESERRRIWNGYRGGILGEAPRLTNRARVGREWLARIGQAPDWSLELDPRGRVVAHAAG